VLICQTHAQLKTGRDLWAAVSEFLKRESRPFGVLRYSNAVLTATGRLKAMDHRMRQDQRLVPVAFGPERTETE
jgi:hypothetical protein